MSVFTLFVSVIYLFLFIPYYEENFISRNSLLVLALYLVLSLVRIRNLFYPILILFLYPFLKPFNSNPQQEVGQTKNDRKFQYNSQ